MSTGNIARASSRLVQAVDGVLASVVPVEFGTIVREEKNHGTGYHAASFNLTVRWLAPDREAVVEALARVGSRDAVYAGPGLGGSVAATLAGHHAAGGPLSVLVQRVIDPAGPPADPSPTSDTLESGHVVEYAVLHLDWAGADLRPETWAKYAAHRQRALEFDLHAQVGYREDGGQFWNFQSRAYAAWAAQYVLFTLDLAASAARSGPR